MLCSKCGKQLPVDAVTCDACGFRQASAAAKSAGVVFLEKYSSYVLAAIGVLMFVLWFFAPVLSTSGGFISTADGSIPANALYMPDLIWGVESGIWIMMSGLTLTFSFIFVVVVFKGNPTAQFAFSIMGLVISLLTALSLFNVVSGNLTYFEGWPTWAMFDGELRNLGNNAFYHVYVFASIVAYIVAFVISFLSRKHHNSLIER